MGKIKTQEFIWRKFAEYYEQNSSSIQPPTSMGKREYAFLLFENRAMVRHKGFGSVEALRDFLLSSTPSDVYYSSAYFEKPEAEMDAKGWLGADLIFDIDADHIPTPCNKKHDLWACKNCGASGYGARPEKCPKCGNQKYNALTWPCDVCLESAKQETIKLIEVLDADFGFSSKEVQIAFSGHRGYHVHVENESVRGLDSVSRKEIVDYLIGIGLEPKLHGFEIDKGSGASLEDFGWRGRIARGVYELLSSREELEKAGLKKTAESVDLQREKILERWKGKGPWGLVQDIGEAGWRAIFQHAIRAQSVNVDTVVTTDIHRLIRLANTLHGESGLMKVEVPTGKIEGFDAFKSAMAFKKGTVTIDVSESPPFRLGDVSYGPFKNQKVELPTAAAMFLLCKGVARVLEEPAAV